MGELERKGRMTDSWKPSTSTLNTISSLLPHVHVAPALLQFRAWHQDPLRAKNVMTQSAWDRTFLSWCAVREERWLSEHPDVEGKVEFDEVTGMPIRPKKMRFVDSAQPNQPKEK